MSDLALRWDVEAADLEIAENDLVTDAGLETAIIVSLFSDRRVAVDEAATMGQTDRRGWWGDAVADIDGDRLGSRLWLLGREKQLPAVLVRAETYAREALAWLLEDRVAARVDVAAEISRPGWLGLAIAITRPGADVAVQYRYDVVWAGQAARAEAV